MVGQTTTRKAPLVRILLFAVAAAFPAWAGISACPPNGTNVALNVAPFFPTSTSNGCTVTNLQFDNFAVGTLAAGTTINGITLLASTTTPPDASQIYGTTSLDGTGLNFNGTYPGASGVPSTSTSYLNCTANNGSVGWCIQGANQAVNSTVQYDLVVGALGLSTINLAVTIDTHSSGGGSAAGATAFVFRQICTGVAANAAFTDAASCGALGGTYFEIQGGVLNGKNQTTTFTPSISIGNLTPGSFVAITDTVYLSTNNGTGSFADIEGFTFGDTPEPATFGMMSLALGAMGILGYRRRKA